MFLVPGGVSRIHYDMKGSPGGLWMSRVLWAAALYNILWGVWVVLSPEMAFRLAGIAVPKYNELWQCIGVMTGAYGIAYAIAAANPIMHWPVVLAGLVAKVFIPIGFVHAAMAGRFPWPAGLMIVANDLIWWAPFSLILYKVYQEKLVKERAASPEIQRMAMRAKTQFGLNIAELSQLSPVLLVFLRHAGCTFCREALSDLAAQRRAIEENGTRMVLVHMGSEKHAQSFFKKYGLDDVARVSDPGRAIYRAFGLPRGSFLKLFGPKVWIRGFQAGVLARHGLGRLVGDGFQMPGVFVLFHGTVLRSYRHQSAADRPDYLRMTALESFPEWERT